MIKIGIKELCHIEKEEIVSRASAYSPFYCEYILSPIGEKESRERLLHSAHRLAVVELLEEFCKQYFAKLPNFAIKTAGKPCFEGESNIHFSFSHSGKLAVCAVSLPDESDGDGVIDAQERDGVIDERESDCLADGVGEFHVDGEKGLCLTLCATARECVGVDIQESMTGELSYKHEKIGERFFDENMLARLDRDKSESNFTLLWCELESLAKMTGEGIGGYDKRTKAGAKAYRAKITDTDGKEYFFCLSYR